MSSISSGDDHTLKQPNITMTHQQQQIIRRYCELCQCEASVYCPSDNAYLCVGCDAKVHCANFLVARHVRSSICSICRNLDGNRFSGASVPPPPTAPFCRSCGGDDGHGDGSEDDSLSSCSSCVSSTGEEVETTSLRRGKGEGVKRRREKVVDLKVEGVLVNWCKRMGVIEEREIVQVVSMAVELLSGCLDNRITVLPFRVTLAASFWVAIRVCRGRGGVQCLGTCQDVIKRVEQISGVPAKLILATEVKLARGIKRRRSCESHEEGWAEC